ncbi:MAG: GNAT family N-acetyltransferase [Syntrophales bacterium]
MPKTVKSTAEWEKKYLGKIVPVEAIFGRIRKGDTIFISSACAEPKYLVDMLLRRAEAHPEIASGPTALNLIRLGIAPYSERKFKDLFRRNSFFIDDNIRNAVNLGRADYTPLFLSSVPELIYRGLARIDAALIQTSPPDEHGYMSLGISVDIAKAAVEKSGMVIAQVNSRMPRVLGDTFIHVKDVDFLVPHDENLLEYAPEAGKEISLKIGNHVASLIEDGDTIQVGYGSIPNTILSSLSGKKDLGVHTELIGDGIVALMKKGVINNTRKTINRGKTVATFCMGSRSTYEYLHDNPSFEFRTIDYTNHPLVIARHENMVAINSALAIDLTGQATAESIGRVHYSAAGGQTNFMRGAALSKRGKSILALESTASAGKASRIVPALKEGSSATLTRGDIHYVVTEYGIAYLRGKSIRERAMELISIAHPKFRPWLVEEARKSGLIYRDQAFIPGERGQYPDGIETYRTTKAGLDLFLRPIKISDEPLLKDFIHSLSDQSLYRRFISKRMDMPHERLQELVIIDYTEEMAIVAMAVPREKDEFIGVGRYYIDSSTRMAEVAFAVRDDYQGLGVGTELLSYLTYLAKRQGLLGFTADVLADNEPMLRVFAKGGFEMEKRIIAGLCELKMMFK